MYFLSAGLHLPTQCHYQFTQEMSVWTSGWSIGVTSPFHQRSGRECKRLLNINNPLDSRHPPLQTLSMQDRVGSVEEGKYAEIIAVSGDPLADITELERVKFVMIEGQVVHNEFKQ